MYDKLQPLLTALILFTLCAPAGRAEEPRVKADRNLFRVEATDGEIVVDGVLDEPAWEQATLIPIGYEWLPNNNTEPPVRTDCLVTYDEDNLYVAFRAFDPEPAKIRAYFSDRDAAFADDTVGFLVDTFNDRRRAFEFRVNPLGVQMEATVSDVSNFGAAGSVLGRRELLENADWSWDAIWDSAGRITEDGYVVEIALPVKQLRFARTADIQSWGFLATRHYPRSFDREFRSAYNDNSLNCAVCQFDSMTGFQRFTAGRNLELTPTLTARRSEQPVAGTSDDEVDAGLSLRWGVTSNVTLNAAVNPDFSQVEADVAQLDVNERFALFFPEKRPFFLDGADFFSTPVNVTFTRSIADPSGAVKLTGKEGRNAFGVLFAEDEVNSFILPTFQSSDFASVDQDVRTGWLRYRRDVGATSSIGLVYAGREADDYFNRVFGVDGSLRLSAADTVVFQLMSSDTDYPDEVSIANGQPFDAFSGTAWDLSYRHRTRDWRWRVGVSSLDREFRADSGFLPQVDRRTLDGVVVRNFWSDRPDHWYSRLAVQVDYGISETEASGERFDEGANVVLIWEGRNQSVVQVGLRPNRETFQGFTVDNFRRDVLYGIRPSGNLDFEVLWRGGEIIDFVNVRQAEFEKVAPKVSFRAGRAIAGDFRYNWESYRVADGGGTYLTANLAQGTFYYHFNARTFVRAIFQYRRVERDLDLYDVPVNFAADSKSGLSQLLFSYKLNPKTVFFLGYSDNYRGNEAVDFDQTNRALFMKIGYAWIR